MALFLCAASALQLLPSVFRARLGPAVAAEVRPGDIQMIASVTCLYCEQARTWFKANRVPFTECEIERDAQCASVYNALMAPGTPVLVVRGRRLVGFSPRAVLDALRAAPS